MVNLIRKKKPLKTVLRENKRTVNRAVRELDREKVGLEREEKRLADDIKKAARGQQMATVKIMAKDLVRTRQQVAKLIEMRSHLQGCALKLQTVKSHQAMAEAMNNTTKAMVKMNKTFDTMYMSKIMAQFEKENAKTEMMQEIMGDAIDDTLQNGVETEEEENEIVDQVLDEIGISMSTEIPDAANLKGTAEQNHGANLETSTKLQPTAVGEKEDEILNDLEARLNNLKR